MRDKTGLKKSASYISRSDLDNIQANIANISVPSWVTKLNNTFGEKSNGKLKAAEWRSLFGIYLPMILVQLWTGSKERWADSKQRGLHLKAVLDLSIIVNVTCSTTSSSNGTALYTHTIRHYLELISALFPTQSLVITHHLALHLPQFMNLHGPCRTHWAFPFERLIGKLQRTLHNGRIGESQFSAESK
jgi:hypothetical protein